LAAVLKELRVRNLAVIETVAVPFGPGLNVLTGETGAGKSLLLDALTLLLGERAQPADSVRAGADVATLEGVFTVGRKSPVPALLDEHGIAVEDGEVVVRRELVRGGRGRVFVNDAHATLAVLERLGEALLEVHGQHATQALLRPGRHLELVDAFGGLGVLREKLRQRYEEWQAVAAQLAELRARTRDKAARLAEAQQAVADIDAARLRPGEEEALRDERRRLQNAGRLAEGVQTACGGLYDDAGAAYARIGQALAALRDLSRHDPALESTIQALEAAAVGLDEAVRALRGYRDGIVFDPPRLEEVERRLDEIGRLRRRYGDTVEAVLAHRASREAELTALQRSEADEAELSARIDRLRAELGTRASDLSARRAQALGKLEEQVTAELAALELDKAGFRGRMAQEAAGPDDLAVGPDGRRLTARGVDHLEFLFSANPGEELRPLARVASGGELSRAMLALKVVLAAADRVPILVFDEVDAGIGGKTADAVGRKLRQVARARQVLCVTHLPQIAAYADHHLRVEKREEQGRTIGTVSVLAKTERVREVARMLGGESVTDTSLRHALELIDQARAARGA
jgi:DNA repair protein RecN (Recombination protein N)